MVSLSNVMYVLEVVPDHIKAPDGIELRQSAVDKTRVGAWCVKPMPAGSILGPFVGEVVYVHDEKLVDYRFSWEVYNTETSELLYILNATDPKKGNWMRYVNCARYLEEQNLVSVQGGKDVYFRTIKDIREGEELLIWYEPFKNKRQPRNKTHSMQTPKGICDDRQLDVLQYSSGGIDIHICGGCKTQFHDVDLFIIHKKQSCPALSKMQNKQVQSRSSLSEPAEDEDTQDPSTEHAQTPSIQNEAISEEVVPQLIAPPLGHEYAQTTQRPATKLPPALNQGRVILTDKGPMIIVRQKTGMSESEVAYPQQQNDPLASLIQHQLALIGQNQQVSIDNGQQQGILVNDVAGQDQQPFQPPEVLQDPSAPRMQLDHNGSFSLVPSSQIPPNLQIPGNPQKLIVNQAVSEIVPVQQDQTSNQHQILKLLLTSQNQVVMHPFQQQQQQTFSGGAQLADLAQQAALISGVDQDFHNISADAQNLDLSNSSPYSSPHKYSIHIKTANQAESENAHLQDNTVSGTHQSDIMSTQDYDDYAISNPALDKARQLLLDTIETSQYEQRRKAFEGYKPKRVRVKKFSCTFDESCPFKTAFSKDLERHIRKHTGEKPFRCDYCEKSFSRVDKLNLHVKGHLGVKPFKCELCDYRSVDRSSVNKHMVTHTRDRKHKCQVCPYACRTASQLTVHLRVHTGDTPFPCSFCQSKFKIKSDLRRHIRTHTGEKPYVCSHCGVKCATNGNLASHYKVHHSTEKQIKCSQCDFSSSSKRVLREHVKSHEPDNPDTTCYICGYQCANKDVLKNHLVTHKAEKEYECNYCSFNTKHKANLVIHTRRRHISILSKKASKKSKSEKSPKISRVKVSNYSKRFEKQFHCNQCDESFVRQDSLNSHIRLHEEMAKSTLSTALTVLKLQQPVINTKTTEAPATATAPPSSSHQQENTLVSSNLDIGNISIIEKSGIGNVQNDNSSTKVSHAEQTVVTIMATTPIQSTGCSNERSTENSQQQHPIPGTISVTANSKNVVETDIGRKQTVLGQENLISSSDLSMQSDRSEDSGELVGTGEVPSGGNDCVILDQGQGQTVISYDTNNPTSSINSSSALLSTQGLDQQNAGNVEIHAVGTICNIGDLAGSNLSSQPFISLGNQTLGNLGSQTDGNLGNQTGGNQGNQTLSNLGSQTDSNLGNQTGGNQGNQTLSNLGSQTDGNLSSSSLNYETGNFSNQAVSSYDNQLVGNHGNHFDNQTSQLPLQPQLCQLPSIQLVQNISFPLIRLPNGQLISTLGGQQVTGPVLGEIRQNNPSIIMNSSVQGTSSGDFQIQPSIPLQMLSPSGAQNFFTGQRPVEPYGQFTDSSIQPLQSSLQLVLADSTGNNQGITQSLSTQSQNSVQEVTSSTPDIGATSEATPSSDQPGVITIQNMELIHLTAQDANAAEQQIKGN